MSVMAGQLFVAVDRGAGQSVDLCQCVSLCQWVALGYRVGLYIYTCLIGTGQLYIAVAILQFGGDWM